MTVRVAVLQHDIVWEDRDATLARLTPQVRAAADSGAQLIALTEMFATGFSMNTHRTAEAPDGPIVTWMTDQAARHGAWMAGSVALTDSADRATNSLMLVGPDGTVHRYDKRHPFSYAGEHERFAPGDERVSVVIDGVRWSLTVCYDLRFANAYWDDAPSTDAYLVVANWPAARRQHWQALLLARAIENQAYVVAANRVGRGGDLDYAGDSRIIDPSGELLATAAARETMLLGEIDPGVVAATREQFPFMADRRD